MNRDQKIDLMFERFVHPHSGFAKQVYHEGTLYVRQTTGSCSHTPVHRPKYKCPDVQPIEFTRQHMMQHLLHEHTYAPYQVKDGHVKWLCLDVDSYNDVAPQRLQDIVLKLAKSVINLLGVNTFLVEHSGSKGYHVWVFFDTPCPLPHAHSLGHKIIEGVQRLSDINIEVYPKQNDIHYTGVGTTVKLPLGTHQKTKNVCPFISSTFVPHHDQWSMLQDVTVISTAWVMEHIEPLPLPPSNEQHEEYYPHCLSDILDVGAGEGLRDDSAFKLAAYIRSKGIPKDLAYTMLGEWNKKNHPQLDDDVLEVKIEQGYASMNYGWRPCSNPAFDRVCRSSCPYFQGKVKRRWFGKENPIGVISRD